MFDYPVTDDGGEPDGPVVDHVLFLLPQEPAPSSLVHRQYTALNAILVLMVLLHKYEMNNNGVSRLKAFAAPALHV